MEIKLKIIIKVHKHIQKCYMDIYENVIQIELGRQNNNITIKLCISCMSIKKPIKSKSDNVRKKRKAKEQKKNI